MQTWIVRIVLAVLTLEAGVCAAFLADDWKVLRHEEENLFESALSLARGDREFVLDHKELASRVRFVRPLQPGLMQRYFHVPVKEAINDSSPPVPEDWGLLLKHMHEVGCEVAAIEQPLTWEGEDFFDLSRLGSLNSAIAMYDLVVLTVDLQRVPTHEPIPDFLRRSAIPLKNVEGEVGSLVRVNRAIHPPSATAAPNTRFSFRVQESVEDATPAFVRWDDYLIPSFPLAVAMAQNNVTPEQVSIELGRHIRLGDGPIVKIDEIGQLQLESVQDPLRAALDPDNAVLASQIPAMQAEAGPDVPRVALFPDGTAENPAPWHSPEELQGLVSAFDLLPRPTGLETHLRLDPWTEILLLSLIAVMASLLVTFRSLFRVVGFGILALMLCALIVALFVQSQRWTPLTPVVVTCAIGFLLSFRLARYLPEDGASVPEQQATS